MPSHVIWSAGARGFLEQFMDERRMDELEVQVAAESTSRPKFPVLNLSFGTARNSLPAW